MCVVIIILKCLLAGFKMFAWSWNICWFHNRRIYTKKSLFSEMATISLRERFTASWHEIPLNLLHLLIDIATIKILNLISTSQNSISLAIALAIIKIVPFQLVGTLHYLFFLKRVLLLKTFTSEYSL